MTDYNRSGSGDLDAQDSTGTPILHDTKTGQVTLGIGTYYVPLGDIVSPTPAEASLLAIHLAWVAAFAATITVEASNFNAKLGGSFFGGDDVSDHDATPGNWIPVDPTNAYGAAAGAGNTVAGATITAGGTNAGGAALALPYFGFRRARLKIVTTVGGQVRISARGKLGD